jgi:hypothetical protein
VSASGAEVKLRLGRSPVQRKPQRCGWRRHRHDPIAEAGNEKGGLKAECKSLADCYTKTAYKSGGSGVSGRLVDRMDIADLFSGHLRFI